MGFQFFGTIFGGLIFFQCVVMDYYQYYGDCGNILDGGEGKLRMTVESVLFYLLYCCFIQVFQLCVRFTVMALNFWDICFLNDIWYGQSFEVLCCLLFPLLLKRQKERVKEKLGHHFFRLWLNLITDTQWFKLKNIMGKLREEMRSNWILLAKI